jgi:hypothetical protein
VSHVPVTQARVEARPARAGFRPPFGAAGRRHPTAADRPSRAAARLHHTQPELRCPAVPRRAAARGRPRGLAFFTGLLDSGQASRADVVRAVLHSLENIINEVRDLYPELLRRPVDPGGLESC